MSQVPGASASGQSNHHTPPATTRTSTRSAGQSTSRPGSALTQEASRPGSSAGAGPKVHRLRDADEEEEDAELADTFNVQQEQEEEEVDETLKRPLLAIHALHKDGGSPRR